MKINNFIITVMLLLATPAVADPITINSNNVDITYDQDQFDPIVITQGPWGEENWLPSTIISISPINNGILLNFNNALSINAIGSAGEGELNRSWFTLPISFTTHSGYRIENYSITYSGTYHIINQSQGGGFVQLQSTGASFYDSKSYDLAINSIQGIPIKTQFSAFGIADSSTINGWLSVSAGGESAPNSTNINLQYIQIIANIVPVPETNSYSMLLAGLGVLTLTTCLRRKKESSSLASYEDKTF